MRLRTRILAVLALLVASATPALALDDTVGPTSTAPLPVYAPSGNRLLVGIIVHGREVATLEVIRDAVFYLPFEEFTELAGITVEATPEGLVLVTPIGRVTLLPDDLIERDGVTYLPQTIIEEELASPVRFDAEEFALEIDLAWRSPSVRRPREPVERLTPDVRPPPFSLSTLRFDAQYVDSSIAGTSQVLNTLLAGRVGGGRWQLRMLTDFEGNLRWRDYAWVRSGRGKLFLAGHQRVNLHPVLPGVEVTGMQAAFTNQSLSLFSRTYEPGELLPRRLRPVDSFTGRGPPAGVAELRIDGSIIARVTIGLNGLWSFYEVPVRSFQHSQIQVWLYERHNVLVPVEVQDKTRATSAFMMPKGAWVHQGGAGYNGNLVQDLIDDRNHHDMAGFYQFRYGLTRGTTFETAVQQQPDRLQGMVGVVTRPTRHFVLSAAPAVSDGAFGYHLELDGRRPAWYLRGYSRFHEEGFFSELSAETYDHYLELGHSPMPSLDLALIARDRQEPSTSSQYVLPALSWRPTPSVYLQARPDEFGDYIVNFQYQHRDSARLSVSHRDRTFIDFSMWPTYRTSVFVGVETGGGLEDRYSASAQYVGRGRLRPTILAGPLYSVGEFGYQIKTSAALAQGMLLRVEYKDDPLPIAGLQRERRFFVGLNADLTWVQGRVMAASTRGIREDRGGIAGFVKIEGMEGSARYPLEDLKIIVDGRPMASTNRGGKFYISNLREGVYEVRLDTENLPIELQPVRGVVVAQVAGGAITRLSFTVSPEYGIAGRITDTDGRKLPAIRVQMLSPEGEIVARGVSDRFGLFRVDGLPPGTYTLRVAPDQFPDADLPTREVVITDDFLFGQDLQLPFIVEIEE